MSESLDRLTGAAVCRVDLPQAAGPPNRPDSQKLAQWAKGDLLLPLLARRLQPELAAERTF